MCINFIIFLECTHGLALLENLPDSSFSSSSKVGNMEPRFSRLNEQGNNRGYAGWQSWRNNAAQWIQANLLDPKWIFRVATQGRNFYGHGHVTSYKLKYSLTNSDFEFVLSENSEEITFEGNTDQETIVCNTFPLVLAHFVRLLPQTWSFKVALRWELYSCGIGECSPTIRHPF